MHSFHSSDESQMTAVLPFNLVREQPAHKARQSVILDEKDDDSPQVSEDVDGVGLVGSLDDLVVHNTPSGGGKVSDSTPGGPPDVVGEGEEGVTGERDLAGNALEPALLLLGGERRRCLALSEESLPLLALTSSGLCLPDLARDEDVRTVGAVGTLDSLAPVEGEDARVVSKPPGVGLGSGETRAVDAGLLPGSESNRSSAVGEADRVGLGVLEREGGDDQVGLGGGRDLLATNESERGLGSNASHDSRWCSWRRRW